MAWPNRHNEKFHQAAFLKNMKQNWRQHFYDSQEDVGYWEPPFPVLGLGLQRVCCPAEGSVLVCPSGTPISHKLSQRVGGFLQRPVPAQFKALRSGVCCGGKCFNQEAEIPDRVSLFLITALRRTEQFLPL